MQICIRYYNKAARDAEVVYRRVQQLLRQLNQPDDTISESDVKQFCKHAASLAVIRGTCISDEYDPRSSAANTIGLCNSQRYLVIVHRTICL